MFSYRRILLAVSLLTGLIFAFSSLLTIGRAEDLQARERHDRLQALRVTYEVQLSELQRELLGLARMIASEPAVVSWLSGVANLPRRADGTIAREALHPTHMALQAAVQTHWQLMQDELGVRQLQFLSPDLVSVLRAHAPHEYGDNLRNVRPMLQAAVRTQQARSGFEIGRAFAGLRGVVPVLEQRPGLPPRLVGLIEIGALLDGHIDRLSQSTEVGYGVLLDPDTLSDTMWTSFQPRPAAAAGWALYPLASSRPEIGEWLADHRLQKTRGEQQLSLTTAAGRDYDLLLFPLRDFRAELDPDREAVGALAIWRDVSAEVQALTEQRRSLLAFGFSAFLLAQALIIGVARLSRREWQTQLDERTREVATLAHRNEVLLMAAEEGIFGVDAGGHTRFINNSALRMLGYKRERVEGRDPHQVFHHHHQDDAPHPASGCAILQTLRDGQVRRQEDWFIRRDGSGFPVELTCAPLWEHGQVSGAVVAFHDISARKRQEERLIELANTDPLTGTASRRHFLERLHAELGRVGRHSTQASLLMIDLDHFKRVNDQHGHAAGDEVLRHLAALSRETLRQSDLIGRLGGEEFGVLLPDDDAAGALQVAERLRHALETRAVTTSDGQPLTVTASIGVTSLLNTDSKPEDALKRADQALYQAKAEGRNRVVLHVPADAGTPP